MKRKLNSRRTIFMFLFVLGLIFIFFVGRKFHPETWNRSLILTPNGISHFRKWLDVSGGTKLVFKISYDKYEQVYEWSELTAIKKMIENIVLKNIDNRISGLWVSDYRAYVQSMEWQPYIVVEIGGIADLNQAKEIIGKTVELEFRLPNNEEPSYANKQARKKIAEDLKYEVEQNDWNISSFADARWSENIFYNHWTGVTLWQMPDLYKNKPSLLDIEKGEISNIITDTYDIVDYQDRSGNVKNETLYWYIFYRVNDVLKVDRETASVADVVDVAEQLWYEYEESVNKSDTAEIDSYNYVDGDLVYNLGAVVEWEEAYDIKVVRVWWNALLWASDEEIQAANKQKETTIQNVKNTIKSKDNFADAELLANGWIAKEQLDSLIPNFDENNTEEIQQYVSMWSDFVVYIRNKKAKDEDLFASLVVKNVNQESFESKMNSKVLYDIESVFVQDRETWKTAKSKNGDILNGAYFKYANTSQSQVGMPVVAINFDDKGKEIFCNITSDNVGNQMAIFVWGELQTSPVIRSKICGGTAQIDGDFTMESAKELVDALNDWALPAPLVLMQEEKISPTLWANALTGALIAALIGIVAIFAYMYIMYGRRCALVTLSVLISFIVILWFFMKLADYALSLSGIAAVILSIWMAVDANILIFERMREEQDKWRTLISAIDTAYDRSRPAIRDGNLSTELIAILLFMLGSNMFKWFGTMLTLTVLITIFVNVPLIKTLLKWFYRK